MATALPPEPIQNDLNKVVDAGSRAWEAAKPVINQGLAAGKAEIQQAAPLIGKAVSDVKPYFNGAYEHPVDWMKGHPIGAAAGGVGAAMLLHHVLTRNQKRRKSDGQRLP